jgi:hypothetical protein
MVVLPLDFMDYFTMGKGVSFKNPIGVNNTLIEPIEHTNIVILF